MSKLLFLGASVSQLPAIQFARGEGHEIVACDADPDAVAFRYCDVQAVVDFSDVDAVSEIAARHRVDGILAVCTDRAVVPAALVAERLGLPGLPPDVARAFTHKPTMRRKLALCGVPQPRSRTLDAHTKPAGYASVPLPAVLKPADSGGQRGLFRIDRWDQVGELLPESLAVSRSGEAVLEEFVEGLELNTLFVVSDGIPILLTISDRLRPQGAGFGVGWIHSYPSSLSPELEADVENVAAAAIRALGMRDGIAFPQLIVGTDGVVLIEVAARIAAGQMADLVRLATGIELYRIAIQLAIGGTIPEAWVTPRERRPVAIRFLTASPGVLPVGTVRSIAGLEDVRASRGVLAAGLYFGPGAQIGPLRVDADRRGYVAATGATAKEAVDHATAAMRKLRVRVTPPERVARRRRRVGARILVATALAGAVAGAALWRHGGTPRPLIQGVAVTRILSPTCGCPSDVAHIAFRLLHPSDVGVAMVSSTGAIVAKLFGPRMTSARVIRVAWNGHDRQGVAPDGRYYPDVSFPLLRRSLRLPPLSVESTRR